MSVETIVNSDVTKINNIKKRVYQKNVKKCNVYSLIQNINEKKKLERKNSFLILSSFICIVSFTVFLYTVLL